jgi:hypothetical protein
MTFGAMAAWQAWLLLAGAAAAAAGLFLIKLRPPRTPIPSLLLWRRVLDQARELTLWERIRRAVSLVVTVLIALALTLAITRPGPSAGASVTAGRLLIVMDSSPSMEARTRSGETRWERASAEARRLIAAASGGEIALATTAEGIVEGPSTDGTLIESALDRLDPGGGDAAWPRLANAGAVHFLTDGAVNRQLDEHVIVHSVHEAAPNVAVTALDVRPSFDPQTAGDVYLEIANFSRAAQKVRVTLQRGTATIFERDIDIGAAEALRQVVPVGRGSDRALRARVSARDNALDLDDEAVAWIERARPITVTVVGDRVTWLRTAFERNPDVHATFVAPAEYTDSGDDVLIFAGWAPEEPPRRPALLFAPPARTPWLGGSSASAVERRPRWVTPGTHPVVLGVDPFTLSIERARSYGSDQLVPVAMSAGGTPLVYVRESPEQRMAVVTFGAEDSNLAGAPGFPVLLGNTVDWLTHPSTPVPAAGGADQRATAAHRPGLMSFGEGVARITGPDNETVPLTRVSRAAMGLLRKPGLYVVEGGGARSTVAVNAGDQQLSNLMRSPTLTGARTTTVESGGAGRPWWVYLVIAGFLLVLAEWWTWQRRITV